MNFTIANKLKDKLISLLAIEVFLPEEGEDAQNTLTNPDYISGQGLSTVLATRSLFAHIERVEGSYNEITLKRYLAIVSIYSNSKTSMENAYKIVNNQMYSTTINPTMYEEIIPPSIRSLESTSWFVMRLTIIVKNWVKL